MDWCDEIIKHFWYCCEVASKDGMTQDEALKEMKVHKCSPLSFLTLSLRHVYCALYNRQVS